VKNILYKKFHIGNADPTTFQGNDPVLTVQVPDLKSGSADIDLVYN